MSLEPVITPPSVSWAQRDAFVYLTFNIECEKPDIKIDKNVVAFKGICGVQQKLYEVEIPLYAEINPEKSSYVNKGRLIEVVLSKEKQDDAFWPALTNDKKKHHWLRVDFNRWQDEEESGEDLENIDMFSDKMSSFEDDNKNEDSSCNEEDDLPEVE